MDYFRSIKIYNMITLNKSLKSNVTNGSVIIDLKFTTQFKNQSLHQKKKEKGVTIAGASYKYIFQ